MYEYDDIPEDVLNEDTEAEIRDIQLHEEFSEKELKEIAEHQ